jgi:hypothetical protein
MPQQGEQQMVLVSDVYQSRTDQESAIIQRQDPVVYPGPHAKGGFALSEHQLRGYRKNGFVACCLPLKWRNCSVRPVIWP